MANTYSIDLNRDQTVCDRNYLRLLKLLPDLAQEDEREFLLELPGRNTSPVITVTVTDRARYTTELVIRQSAPLPHWAGTSAMSVRVYHDARMAEIIEFNGERRFEARYQYPNARMHQEDEKSQLNRFFGEWLEYCLQYGLARCDALSAVPGS